MLWLCSAIDKLRGICQGPKLNLWFHNEAVYSCDLRTNIKHGKEIDTAWCGEAVWAAALTQQASVGHVTTLNPLIMLVILLQ